MKLFPINIGGRQALQRDDPMAPVRETIATGAVVMSAIEGGVDLYQDYSADKAEEEYEANYGKYSEMLKEEEDFITNNREIPAIDSKEPPDDEAVVTDKGVEMQRPAMQRMHEIGSSRYKQKVEDVFDAIDTNVSDADVALKLKHDLYSKVVSTGGETVRDKMAADRIEFQRGNAQLAMQRAVNSGDIAGAYGVLGRNSGAFTSEESAQLKIDIMSRGTMANITREMYDTNSVAGVNSLREKLYTGDLKPADQMSMESKLSSRINEIVGIYEKSEDKRSGQLVNGVIASSTERPPADTAEELQELTRGMNEDDSRMVMKLELARGKEGDAESDPDTVATIGLMINDIQAAPNEETAAKLRGAARRAITSAQEHGRLVYKDARDMITDMNKMEDVIYKNPRLEEAVDNLFQTLTGVSKSAFDSGATNAANLFNATRAVKELRKWGRSIGDGADFNKWIDDNIGKYKTKSVYKAEVKADENIIKKFVRYDNNGNFKLVETSELFNNAVSDGEVRPEDEERLRGALEGYINRISDQEQE